MPEMTSIIKPGRSTIILFFCICASLAALALDPSKRISQYAHMAWRIQDGAFNGAPNAIAQTKDGYLWIGTEAGLVRFDGVRFVPWSPPNRGRLPDPRIYSLLGSRNGSLWIGTGNGPAHWTGKDLTDFPNVGAHINAFLEKPDGSVWLTRSRVNDESGALCRAIANQITCYGTNDGIPVPYAGPLVMDPAKNLWVGSAETLFRWNGSSSQTFQPKDLNKAKNLTGVNGLAVAWDGSLWVGIQRAGPGLGLERIVHDQWRPLATPDFDGSTLEVTSLFLDRENSLWVGTARDGVYRIHENLIDHFRHADGLSGDSVNCLFQDVEGTLWVATSRGLDSFHDLRVTTFSTAEGLSSDRAGAVIAGRDGTVWVANSGALDSIRNGRVSSIRRENGLPGTRVTALLEDREGTLWLGIDDGLWTYSQGRFTPLLDRGKTLGTTVELAEDDDGNIWADVIGSLPRIVRIKGNQICETVLPGKFAAYTFFVDKSGLWLSLRNHQLGRYQNGQLTTLSMKTAQDTGEIQNIFPDIDGAIWGTTRTGLILRRNGETKSLGPQNGYRCDRTYALIIDVDRSLWAYSTCGLLKITRQQIDRWWRNSDAPVETTRFDAFDGAQPAAGSFNPKATLSADGRVWFANDSVVQVVDPSHLETNSVPPPVTIETIIADRRAYSPTLKPHLPALTRDLEIDYTGLSFIAPQKIRFRYILEGRDQGWQDVGTRRQAFYSDLRPGKYRFRLLAANADGLWNESGAEVQFSVLPAYYQTLWFRLFCVVGAVAFLWYIYRFRLRRLGRVLNERFEERMAERTRLARELHDTLLQTLQGSKLFADTSLNGPPDAMRMHNTIASLSNWLERAILEVRTSLHYLRASVSRKDTLAEALHRAAEDFRQSAAVQVNYTIIGTADGTEPEMNPVVREEIFRIGYEAILNACRHSRAGKLEVKLAYFPDLTLTIHDNGQGMESGIVVHGKDSHFGLQGMRERAKQISAVLTIESEIGAGTKVELRVPRKIAFPQQNAWTALSERVRTFFKASGQAPAS